MKHLLPSAVLLLGVASAQSASFQLPGIGQVVSGNGARQTFKCDAQTFEVAGNQNTITLTGTCTKVSVKGDKNTVKLETVGQITVEGKNNTVTWRKALKGRVPAIKSTGSGNVIKITK